MRNLTSAYMSMTGPDNCVHLTKRQYLQNKFGIGYKVNTRYKFGIVLHKVNTE